MNASTRQMTGSFTNRMMESGRQPTPTVGMGATICLYTDRHAATIVEVRSATRIVIQRDRAIRTDGNGMSECQAYRYERQEGAAREVFTLRKNGRWIREGEAQRTGTALAIGDRREYHDFSF